MLTCCYFCQQANKKAQHREELFFATIKVHAATQVVEFSVNCILCFPLKFFFCFYRNWLSFFVFHDIVVCLLQQFSFSIQHSHCWIVIPYLILINQLSWIRCKVSKTLFFIWVHLLSIAFCIIKYSHNTFIQLKI